MEVLNGKILLVVDDEPDLRSPIVAEFESLGCTVFEASNGVDAFKIVQKEKIDAVISDIRMPGGDGVELLKNIKSLHHAVPIVMLITGFSDLSREEAYDLDAEAILAKPFDLDEIDQAVVNILTPPSIKWAADSDPAKSKKLITKTFNDLSQATMDGQLNVGRGGLFVHAQKNHPFVNEEVAIQIQFSEGDVLEIEGTGIVRWVRRDQVEHLPPGFGLEFASLSRATRESVLALTRSLEVRSFIPKS